MNKPQIRIFLNTNPSYERIERRKYARGILEFSPDQKKIIAMSPNKMSKLKYIKTLLA